MTQSNNDIEELEELLTELEGQEAQLVRPYSEDDDAVTQLMDAPVGDQEWMVQVTALDRRMMSTEQLLSDLRSGKLSNRTLVWRGGMEDWLPISRVDSLASAGLPIPSAPRMAMGLPPPPAALPPAPMWSSLPSAPLGPPPTAMPPTLTGPGAMPPAPPNPSATLPSGGFTAPALGASPLPPPSSPMGLPPPSQSSGLPRAVSVPPPAPSEPSHGNTTRPVAVDFVDFEPENTSPLRGKRAILALSAVAILAVFVTAYALSSKSDDSPTADQAAEQPQAVSALQPSAGDQTSKPEPAAVPATKPNQPEPSLAASKPAEPEPAADPTDGVAARQTNAPARYSPRSEYRRRIRGGASSGRSEDDKEAEAREVPEAEVAERATPSAPQEEAASSEVASSPADDDADSAEAPKSTGKPANTFNREAAKAALEQAADQARNCRPAGGPSGTGQVQVRYEPSGKVASVAILTSKFENTTAGSCVRMLFRRAKVPEFTGAPVVVVNKRFEIP